uniref:Uncharacterized protein n=1 Tax=viral metagenome TaxID=1070528 RepID=A0A6C0HHM1_9ZZZZ
MNKYYNFMYDIINTRLPPVNTPTVDLAPQQFNKYMINMARIQNVSELKADEAMAEEAEKATVDEIAQLQTTPQSDEQELAYKQEELQKIQQIQKSEQQQPIVGGTRKKSKKRNTYKKRASKYKKRTCKCKS